MEHASQALLISAGILIGILILSLGVYLFHTFGNYVNNTQADIAENTLNQFNEKYLKYHQVEDLTIQDIITVKNNALENNLSYDAYIFAPHTANGNNDFIDVYIGSSWILNKTDEELLKNEIENYTNIPTYSCQVQISTNTGRVFKIIFTRNT